MPFVPSASWQEDPLVNQRGDPQSGALVLHSSSAVRAATLCWNGDDGWGGQDGMEQCWSPGLVFSSEQGSNGQMPSELAPTSTGTEQL